MKNKFYSFLNIMVVIILIIPVFVFADQDDKYDPKDLSDYFGTMKACTNDGSENDCRNGNEYKFYLKMYDIYFLYQRKYNVKLDLSLIMSALFYGEEDLPTVFKNNLNSYDRNAVKNSNSVTNLDWEYDYKNDSCYTYLNANDFSYDMQILAKNMVKKEISYKCSEGNGGTAEDIETSNYSTETLKCEKGEYDKDSVSASYKLDLDKYKEFLSEYVKLKYHTPGVEVKDCNVNIPRDGNYVSNVNFLTGNFGNIHYYNQGDYYNSPYGDISGATISSHGCGPTSLAIVISSILNEDHDPVELTNYVCSRGACTAGGTSWDGINDAAKHYGLNVKDSYDNQEVVDSLASGNSLVISLMCPGHFTSGGHFIVLTGVTSDGKVTVADPASTDRSTAWDFNTVAEETCNDRKYWIISPGANTKTNTGNNNNNGNNSNSKKITGVQKLNQYTEGLPTGCETVSAVMLMNYYTNNTSITSSNFASQYLIKKNYSNGYGPDPNSAFVGSPFTTSNSYGIYAPAMAKSMNKYLSGRGLTAVNISGTSIDKLKSDYIDKGKPIMFWATIDMKAASNGDSWEINYVDDNAKYKKGSTFTWKRPEHCLVLVGYDSNNYYFNDPNTGKEEKYSKSAVEAAYKSLGQQAIIIK